jgi:catechol 2,3-dioxygenase-like lactoylglutathione lyase family enzyme
MITGIAHTCYLVQDLAAALAFYRDVLGLREAFDFVREDGTRYGVYLHVGGRSFIELFEKADFVATEGGAYQHLCLEVDDIAATVTGLRARGAEVSEPKLGMDRSWQAWTADPAGNRIELHCYNADSKQAPYL